MMKGEALKLQTDDGLQTIDHSWSFYMAAGQYSRNGPVVCCPSAITDSLSAPAGNL